MPKNIDFRRLQPSYLSKYSSASGAGMTKITDVKRRTRLMSMVLLLLLVKVGRVRTRVSSAAQRIDFEEKKLNHSTFPNEFDLFQILINNHNGVLG